MGVLGWAPYEDIACARDSLRATNDINQISTRIYALIPHLSESKITQNTPSRAVWPVSGVEQKIGGFDVSMYDVSGMNISEGTEEVAEIGLERAHRLGLEVFLPTWVNK